MCDTKRVVRNGYHRVGYWVELVHHDIGVHLVTHMAVWSGIVVGRYPDIRYHEATGLAACNSSFHGLAVTFV